MTAPFRHRLRVRWGECDEQGVVYFVNYAEYVDLALTELWRERVRPYPEMVASGTDLMVVAIDATFRRPARFDEEVDVVLEVDRLGETSLTSAWRVERDGEVLCSGTITHVCIDPAEQVKKRIPDDLRAALS
jgi:acyl-CoA thioester hydrolase